MRIIGILFLLISWNALAQNESPNLESFELPDLPACWQTIDADADGFNWNSWFDVSDGGEVLDGNTGTGMMVSASYDNEALVLTPDNYLILPQLDIQEGESLTYFVAGLDPQYSEERYSIVLSETGAAAEDFTTTLLTDTTSSEFFEEITVELDAYVGQQVYIAFRHHDVSNQFILRIDDVQYPTTVNDCPILVSVEEQNDLEIGVFPNPAQNQLTITVNTVNSSITLTDVTGKVVLEEISLGNKTVLDVSEFQNGIYLLRVETASGIETERVVISH